MDILQVPKSNNIRTYLGCRNMIGKEPQEIFFYLKRKNSSKLARWIARILLQVDKVVLIKSNLKSIPFFTRMV